LRLSAQGVRCRPLRVDYAFHSPQMEPLQRELIDALGRLAPRRAAISMYSTVTGDEVLGEELDAAYWGNSIRMTVRFEQAIRRALTGGHRLFLEVGPHPVLTMNLDQCISAGQQEGCAIPTLRKQRDGRRSLLEALGTLYTSGYAIDWKGLYPESGRVVGLPTYPWQRKRYWVETTGASRALAGAVNTGHPLLGAELPVAGTAAAFEATLSVKALPYLADHRVFDDVVMSGAGIVELVYAAAATHFGPGRYRIKNLALPTALLLPEEGARRVQVILAEVTAEGTAVAVYSRSPEAKRDDAWTLHAKGYVQLLEDHETPAPLDLDALRSRCQTAIPVEEAYAKFVEAGPKHGPAFQGMAELWHGNGETLSRVKVPEAAGGSAHAYGLHPALLDAALQTMARAMESPGDAYLPFEFGDAAILHTGMTDAWVHARRYDATEPGAEVGSGIVTIADDRGHVLVEISNLSARPWLRFAGRGRRQQHHRCTSSPGRKSRSISTRWPPRGAGFF
jgi:acyl transferase domain-containing protein